MCEMPQGQAQHGQQAQHDRHSQPGRVPVRWSSHRLVDAYVYPTKESMDLQWEMLRRNQVLRKDCMFRRFKRDVRAGGVTVTVWVIVVRLKAAPLAEA